MRDRSALALLLAVAVLAGVGLYLPSELSPEERPDATFAVRGAADGELTVSALATNSRRRR